MSPLKPPVRARRVRALVGPGRVALTAEAIEELFRAAEVLCEGGLDDATPPRWYGSVMVTFDLARVAQRCRGLDDPEALDRFVLSVEGSVRVRLRTHRLACAEVGRRYPDREIGTAYLESTYRRAGDRLLLDIDLEVPLDRDGSQLEVGR